MDNDENKKANTGEKNSPSDSAGKESVRYQKVNIYDNTRAFDKDSGYPSSRGGYGNRPSSYQRGRSYNAGERGHSYSGTGSNSGYRKYSPKYSLRQSYSGEGAGSQFGYGSGYKKRSYSGGYSGQSSRPSGGYYNKFRSNSFGNEGAAPHRMQHGRIEHSAAGSRFVPRPARIEYKEDNFDPDAPVRLNKFLANAGVCSRRDADEYIQAGLVTVNGETVTELGTKIKRSDSVRFNNEPVTLEKKVYVLLNKPKDYVTTSDDPQNRKTVMDLVKGACRERIYPVGRLDRNTTGVLLLTNDGELASKLTHPKYKKKKIYHVYVDRNVSAADMQKIADGIKLDDGEVHADAIEYASPTDKKQIGIEIHSGRNRIVRRIFESLGYHVTKLDRVYFAGLTKKNLSRGAWRYLTQEEVNFLKMGEFE